MPTEKQKPPEHLGPGVGSNLPLGAHLGEEFTLGGLGSSQLSQEETDGGPAERVAASASRSASDTDPTWANCRFHISQRQLPFGS